MFRLELGTDTLFKRLSDVGDTLSDMTPIYDGIGEYMVSATMDRFKDSEAPDGTRWRQKSPTTIKEYFRKQHRMLPDPLIGPAALLSVTPSSFTHHDGVEIGSNLQYSGVMQFGALKGAFGVDARGRPLPWGDIPARPWLGISDADERNILGIVEDHLRDVFDADNLA